MTPQDRPELENEMVQIPAQSWYGLVVYDLPADNFDAFFRSADPAVTDVEGMVTLCERGLTFISDRFVDGSHDKLESSNMPDTDRLKSVAGKLERWRKHWIVESCDFEINREAINDYLGDNYTRDTE